MSDEVNYEQAAAEFAQLFGIENAGEEQQATTGADVQQADTGTEAASDADQNQDSPAESEAQQSEQAGQEQAAKQQTQQRSKEEKQHQAFARMRVENASLQKTVGMLAQALGVNAKGRAADEVSADLQNRLTAVLAKQQGVDPQIMSRLNQLEEINARWEQSQAEQRIVTGLTNIQENYGATQDDLRQFIAELQNDNFDINKGDIESEFLKRNFQKIMDNKVNAAVKAEQERAAKGSGASQPPKKQGQDDKSEAGDINSMRDFESMLNKAVFG